ncbi:aldo/keto reductase [Chlamydiales bacterium]|nr:aldo/keto reductase [Chlamydiales bacterium]
MEYRRLGKSGLEVSSLSLGSWITFGSSLDINGVKECIDTAIDHGVNYFDNAEVYANGVSELLMGEALKGHKRDQLVISTKIFWGGKGPNQTGLNWKHVVEGVKNSLNRLRLDYVDLLFCHRPDPNTPIEETVRAIESLIREGLVFYWGTSEWDAKDIDTAYELAYQLHMTPLTMEQPEYNLFHRQRVEVEYAPLYRKWGMGTTIWSPLASGLLSGKYNEGIPEGSRLHQQKWIRERLTTEKIEKVKLFSAIANELGCTPAQLAIAWCLKNPQVSSVITGASTPSQIIENVQASVIQEQLDEAIMDQIEEIFPLHEKVL